MIGQRVLRLMLLSCLIRFPSSFSFSLWMLDALFCWLIDAYLFHWLQLPLGRRKLPSWSHVYERSLCSSNWVDVVERKVQIASATLRSSLSARLSKFTLQSLFCWLIYIRTGNLWLHSEFRLHFILLRLFLAPTNQRRHDRDCTASVAPSEHQCI